MFYNIFGQVFQFNSTVKTKLNSKDVMFYKLILKLRTAISLKVYKSL